MKLKKLAGKILHHLYPSFLYTSTCYSQEGEDMIIKCLYENQKGYKGFYVDVGAYHPIRFSNTAYFYKKGWKGINIEPTPGSLKVFNRFRKRDINIEAAVGNTDKPLIFNQFNEPALNSFTSNLSGSLNTPRYYVTDTTHITPVKLSEVLDEHLKTNQKIDFLSLDVEGMEINVLKSNNWSKYTPDYILVEEKIKVPDVMESEVYIYLKNLNYSLIGKTPRTCLYKYDNHS